MSDEMWIPLLDYVFRELKQDCYQIIAERMPALHEQAIRIAPPQDDKEKNEESAHVIICQLLPVVRARMRAFQRRLEGLPPEDPR
jgi:hypothetical protein